MKQWIALLFCAVLLVTVACPVWAEPDESTTLPPVETTTEPTIETTTEPTTETTTDPTVETTTTQPVRHAVLLSIAYENKEIIIRAKDVNGQPVRKAPVKVTADSEVFTGTTNDSGVAKFPMAEEPAQIICSTEAFKGAVFYYEAATASVILHTPTTTTTTTTPTSADVTTTTKAPTTAYRTGTSATWTTSVPLDGNVTVTEIVTTPSSTVEEEPEVEPAEPKSALPQGWALALMIMGAVLLIVAAVVLCLFLFRAPRLPAKEETETEPPVEATAEPAKEESLEEPKDEETEEPVDETPEAPAEESPAEESPAASGAVSLEDLFRDK